MSQLTAITKLKAKSGAEEKLYEECRKLIAPTLAEEGCMNCDLYRSTDDRERRGTFMFYENWASKAHCKRHQESPHWKAFAKNTDGMLEVFEFFQMEKVVNP
jgi:quinol monooxygenase YgiN